MINRRTLGGGILTLGVALASTGQLYAQSGPGASVEWIAGPGDRTTIIYDSPPGYDKHYRICFKAFPDTTSIEIVMSDRTIGILVEDCVDVKSNKIGVRMTKGTEAASGIFFLID